ncbi:tail terminator [Mycobacterium phage Anthony]|uniref:Tail terminator n=1 Tax=Mycobacterium phage Anthony TaxID=2599857 RepID=A0A5J6THD6_9CAUD|nr:tail terminator [Mycobacterium phage Anthony]QFG10393.1 tail terminator [Mycobacterium phage Anthony]
MSVMPRPSKVILPILRAALPDVQVVTWIPDVDDRKFPIINIRRVGGNRLAKAPNRLALPIIEMTAYTLDDIPTTEDLYETSLEALFEAKRKQTPTPFGYIHSIRETMGATQFSSPYQDSWRIQGLIQLGIKPPRTNS